MAQPRVGELGDNSRRSAADAPAAMAGSLVIDSGRITHLQRHWLPMQRLPNGVRVCCIARWPQLGQGGGTGSLGSSGMAFLLSGTRETAMRGRAPASC